MTKNDNIDSIDLNDSNNFNFNFNFNDLKWLKMT